MAFHGLHRHPTMLPAKGHKSEQPSLWVVVQNKTKRRYNDQTIHHAPEQTRDANSVHVARVIPTPNSCTYS
jgi:hypothetical protein